MSNSQHTQQAALCVLSTLLDTISRETESVFTATPMEPGQSNGDCRLLEVRSANDVHGFTISFSEDLVFQIVDLMAGGSSCHFTKIVGKPFTEFELSIIKHIFGQCFGERCLQLKGLGTSSDSMRRSIAKSDFSFYIVGPKSECFAHVVVNSVADFPSKSEPSFDSRNHTNFGLEDLPLDFLAETLRYELPQTCALALQMMRRESAARVLKMLPWELQQDVGVRVLTMGKVNSVASDLLGFTFQIGSRIRMQLEIVIDNH